MSVATLLSPTETYVSQPMTAEVVVPKALVYEMVEGQPKTGYHQKKMRHGRICKLLMKLCL